MRSYNQFCPAARALDLLGERWTLLIVRELLFGPKRYTDLQEGLPGIGPTLLSQRLRAAEAAGLIRRRRLAPPAASTVYELTELGEDLRPLMAELFRWGMRNLGGPGEGEAIRASWLIAATEATIDPAAIPDLDESYEFRVGDEVIAVTAGPSGVAARQGPAEAPAFTIQTDPVTFAGLGSQRITPDDAVRQGRMRVSGDSGAADRCGRLFRLFEAGTEARAAA